MKGVIVKPNGRKLTINVSDSDIKASTKDAWVKKMVKLHEGMGVENDVLTEKFGEMYDLVKGEKKAAKKEE